MRLLRYAYVVALTVWVGGTIVAGLIVAPVTFGVLETWNATVGRVLAGDVFGAVLARLNLAGYAAGAVMCVALTGQRLLGPRPRSYGIRIALIAAMLAFTWYSGQFLAPRIDLLQSEISGPMSNLPADDARKIEFDALHQWSTSLAMATIVAGLGLLGWETRE